MSDKLSYVRLVINSSIHLVEIAKEVQWKRVLSDMSFKFVLILNDKRYKGEINWQTYRKDYQYTCKFLISYHFYKTELIQKFASNRIDWQLAHAHGVMHSCLLSTPPTVCVKYVQGVLVRSELVQFLRVFSTT